MIKSIRNIYLFAALSAVEFLFWLKLLIKDESKYEGQMAGPDKDKLGRPKNTAMKIFKRGRNGNENILTLPWNQGINT